MTEPAEQPTTPAAATARLTELTASPDWRGKVDSQDPAAFAEFQALTKTAAGNTAALSEAMGAANNAKLVADYLASPPAGFPPLNTPAGAELAQILKGEKTITPELHGTIKAKLDSMLADREWQKRFDSKDQTALREFNLATVLLTAEVSA